MIQSLSLLALPLLFLLMETTIKALTLFPLPLPPDRPQSFPTWPPMAWLPLLLKSVILNNKLPCQWQLSPDLLLYLYLKFSV